MTADSTARSLKVSSILVLLYLLSVSRALPIIVTIGESDIVRKHLH